MTNRSPHASMTDGRLDEKPLIKTPFMGKHIWTGPTTQSKYIYQKYITHKNPLHNETSTRLNVFSLHSSCHFGKGTENE